jgi:hypothetical protein
MVVTVCCAVSVLFPLQRRDDSHVQHASLRLGHECAHHLCQKAVIIPCLSQKRIAKVIQACNFYGVACPGLKSARG